MKQSVCKIRESLNNYIIWRFFNNCLGELLSHSLILFSLFPITFGWIKSIHWRNFGGFRSWLDKRLMNHLDETRMEITSPDNIFSDEAKTNKNWMVSCIHTQRDVFLLLVKLIIIWFYTQYSFFYWPNGIYVIGKKSNIRKKIKNVKKK